jgi:hypothetical protein
MRTHLWIAAILFPMVNAVLFGIGVTALLSIPAMSEQASSLFWIVVATSFVIAAPVSWFIAPRLQARYWRKRRMRERMLER